MRAVACCAMAAMSGIGWAQTSSSAQATGGTQTPSTVQVTSGKLASADPVTYANRYELYGGLQFMNFQAGQTLPTRMNLGGIELQGTDWITNRIGIVADFRGDAGTTPTTPTSLAVNSTKRPLVVLYQGLFGAEYRGPKNQRAALNFHALGGVAYGDFTESGLVVTQTQNPGLYNNHAAPMFAVGGSLDLNRSKRVALRLSPDLLFEHFGTETREFFAISGGIVYRIGKK